MLLRKEKKTCSKKKFYIKKQENSRNIRLSKLLRKKRGFSFSFFFINKYELSLKV